MALQDICKTMKSLLESIRADLEKAEFGNKAAAQRVRTGTIKLDKVAKLYRKESVSGEKTGVFKKLAAKKKEVKQKEAKAKKAARAAKAKPAKAKKPAAKKPAAKKKAKKVVKKGAASRSSAKRPVFAKKKATAKLPTKRK